MATENLTRPDHGHLTRRTPRSPDSSRAVALQRAVDDFLLAGRVRGLSPRTLAWYSIIASRFVVFRAKHRAKPGLDTVTIAEARAFVTTLQDAGLSPSSVAGFVRGLKVIFAWCAAEGLVEADPLRRLPRPREPRRLIATLGRSS